MKKFKRIYVEITNVCNKNCSFCAKTNRLAEIMNVSNFEKIIDKIIGHTEQVYFHVMGEPLVNDNIGTFLDVCYKNNIKVNLNTNGTLLRQRLGVLIDKPALRKVIVSLHSFNANNMDNLEEYLNDVLYCVNNLKTNSYVELRMWNVSGKQLNNMLDKQVIDKICKFFGYTGNIDLSTSTKYTLDKNVFLDFGNLFVWPCDNKEVFHDGFCYALRTQIAILVDGSVVPCCLDNNGEMTLGNIFKDDLDSIINSERAKNIYDNFTNHKKVENLCLHCNYLNNKNDK